jgi:hypothetical protein
VPPRERYDPPTRRRRLEQRPLQPRKPPQPEERHQGAHRYGERSRFVTSLREPAEGRPSPDAFGLTFHVVTPLGESVGSITPSSLHYVAAHRGFYVPEIDPRNIG